MKTKLIITIFAVAFGLCLVPVFAAVDNIKVSGDITTTGIARDLSLGLEGPLYVPAYGNTKDSEAFITSQMRLRFDADLTDDVEARVGLINERVWGAETEGSASNGTTDIDLDLAYLKIKNFIGYPVTLKIGRQDLRFGNGLIIGDPDTNQTTSAASGLFRVADALSLRKSFDALRATFDFNPIIVDVVYSVVQENQTNEDDDVTLYGFNTQYLPNDKDVYELYLWVKDRVTSNVEDEQDYIICVGTHGKKELTDRITWDFEVAHQSGDFRGASGASHAKRDAWAAQTKVNYKFNNKAHSMTGLTFTYLSGDADNYGSNGEGRLYTKWDPMFEDQAGGDIINYILASSNTYNAGLYYFTFLSRQLRVLAKYNHTRLVKNHYATNYPITNGPAYLNNYQIDGSSKHLGDEVDVHLTYDYSENTHFILQGGVFLPGSLLISSNDSVAYMASLAAKVDF